MNKKQLEIAHRLAKAQGHEWAVVLSVDEMIALGTKENVSKELCERRKHGIKGLEEVSESGVNGIAYPSFNMNGAIAYCHNPVGISYTVSADGLVKLTIRRPAGEVLRAVVQIDDDDATVVIDRVYHGGTLHLRHVAELTYYLNVLLGRTPVKELLGIGRYVMPDDKDWQPPVAYAELERRSMYKVYFVNGSSMYTFGETSPVCSAKLSLPSCFSDRCTMSIGVCTPDCKNFREKISEVVPSYA